MCREFEIDVASVRFAFSVIQCCCMNIHYRNIDVAVMIIIHSCPLDVHDCLLVDVMTVVILMAYGISSADLHLCCSNPMLAGTDRSLPVHLITLRVSLRLPSAAAAVLQYYRQQEYLLAVDVSVRSRLMNKGCWISVAVLLVLLAVVAALKSLDSE